MLTRVVVNGFYVEQLDSGLESVLAAEKTETDVLVYGATPGGIAAAVSAAKAGHTVTLLEPTGRIGGMLTCGLSNSDFRSFESLTGFFLEFSQRVQSEYEHQYGRNSEQAKAAFSGTHGEPSVNLRVLEAMLGEYPSITILRQMTLQSLRRLHSAADVDA